MFDILALSKFAGPSSVRKLAGRMGWLPSVIHVHRDFLMPVLNILVFTRNEAERTERYGEGIEGFLHRNV